jgi:uncharacterized protein (TIGR02145 family)
MADSLRFGGTSASTAGTAAVSDNNYCTTIAPTSAQSTIIGNINPAWYNVDENGLSTGTNLRGACYNPGPTNEANGAAIGWASATANTGYFYDWGAATQDGFTSGAVGARQVQGICPDGWHLPASNSTNDGSVATILVNDFAYLDKLYGGTGVNNQTSATHARTYFWGIPNNVASLPVAWKGTYPGCSGNAICVSSNRGVLGYWWSSGSADGSNASYLVVDSGSVYPQHSYLRGYGFQVRCVGD